MKDSDIVVYSGAISTAAVFKALGVLEEELRLATKEEINLYKNR